MEENNEGDIQDVPELPTVEDGAEDTTDWKSTALKMQGMAKRFKTKIDKLTISSKPEPVAQPKAEVNQVKGFDYAQKAYLKASGINAEEFDFVKEVMDGTGKQDIDAVLASKYFQAELKERRELKATDIAAPGPSKRAGQTTRTEVDYWIAQGKLPPVDQPELRRKVVNAKIAAETAKSQFSDQSVING